MELFDNLINTFGYNSPFFLKEVKYKKYSLPWIKKELNNLVIDGKIIRYERGLYYIPEKTVFGISKLNPYKIIDKKYLHNNSGYYSGLSFANNIGLSTQMPNKIEIFTNNEKSRFREINIYNQSVILRKTRTFVNKENINVLSFLELMNSFPIDYFSNERKEIIKTFIKENKINRKQITSYSKFFPDLVMRNLIESEIIYDIA